MIRSLFCDENEEIVNVNIVGEKDEKETLIKIEDNCEIPDFLEDTSRNAGEGLIMKKDFGDFLGFFFLLRFFLKIFDFFFSKFLLFFLKNHQILRLTTRLQLLKARRKQLQQQQRKGCKFPKTTKRKLQKSRKS